MGGLLPCVWPECKQMLSCKDALRQHVDTYTEERHQCKQCPKDFNTLSNLKQHEKGAMEKDLFPLAACCSIGLTVEMSIKLTVRIAKLRKKQNLISQKFPSKTENEKRA